MPIRNRLGCLSLILAFALCFSLFVNLLYFAGHSARSGGLSSRTLPNFEEETAVAAQEGEAGADSKIAQISLRGIITSAESGSIGETMVDDLKLQLKQAVADSHVKAIVLEVESPGGEVTASDVIYQAVVKAREKKPVVIYMGSLAASGGYYISCGGSYLIANETTFTGSIGVIMETLNYRTLFDKVGLEAVVFKSGKFKDMLSGARPITDEEKQYVQGLVMQTYDKFVGIVARERKLDLETLKNGIADGRVLSGKDALANKLIDKTGSIEDAYAKAMELGKVPGAAIVRYEAPFKLGKLFRLLGQADHAASNKVEVSLTDSLKPKLETGKLYYLPSIFAQ